MSENTLVVAPHDDLGDDTFHEWWFEGHRVQKDKNGRTHKHGWTPWQTMRCNNLGCGARAIVREAAIAAAFVPNGEPISYAPVEGSAS